MFTSIKHKQRSSEMDKFMEYQVGQQVAESLEGQSALVPVGQITAIWHDGPITFVEVDAGLEYPFVTDTGAAIRIHEDVPPIALVVIG
jgi:hypothetical protein